MKNLLPICLFVFFLITAIFSCKKISSIDGVSLDNWEPDIAFPLVNSKITIGELLDNFGEETYIEEDNNQHLTFVYEGGGFGLTSEEITELIPNFSFPMVDTVFGFPYNLPNNTFVDYIDIKRGTIAAFVANDHPEPVEFTLRIPEIALNGISFEKTFIVGTTIPSIQSYDVKGYKLRPAMDSLNFYYSAKLVNSGTYVTLYSAPDPIIALDSMQYSYAQGFLGTGSIPLPRDTLPIDFFNYFSDGEVFFEDPSITITINNSFGFPFRARFNVLQAVKTDQTIIPMVNSTLNSGFIIDHPSFSEIGQTKQTSFVVDKTNSNIADIIGQPIEFIDYEIEPLANPNNDTTDIGFLTDSSAISLDFLVELPLYGRARNFTILDTFALNLDTYEKVRHVTIRAATANGFPIDAFMQVYFLDQTFVTIDSLSSNYNESILQAAQVDNDGRSIEIAKKTTDHEIPEGRFSRLKAQARYIALKSSINTLDSGQQSVRFYSDYEVGIKLGIIAGLAPIE